jgi:hypothetical protein
MPGKGLEPLRLQRRHLILSAPAFIAASYGSSPLALSYAVCARESSRLVRARER